LNRVSSIFSQLLQWFPRGEFEALVRKHGAERRSKGFSCWGQFVAIEVRKNFIGASRGSLFQPILMV